MRLADSVFKRLMYRFGTRVKSKHVMAFLTRNSRRKLSNLLRVSLASVRKQSSGFGFPYVLVVEPTNRCNLGCPLCPTGRGAGNAPKQNLALHSLRDLVGEIGEYVYVVNFQNWGEPMLAPDLFPMIRHCFENRIFTCVATNGNYSPRLNDRLIESHLDHITFAVDGSTQELYGRYRIRGKLDRVLDNIRDLMAKKEQAGVRHPFVEIQFLVFRHNEHDLPNIRRIARELAVDGLMIRAGEEADNGSNLERYYTWDDQKGFCPRFWYTATITSDGGVVPCCNFFESDTHYGKLTDGGFSAVWKGAAYRRHRQAVLDGSVEELSTVCQDCKVYNPGRVSFPVWRADG